MPDPNQNAVDVLRSVCTDVTGIPRSSQSDDPVEIAHWARNRILELQKQIESGYVAVRLMRSVQCVDGVIDLEAAIHLPSAPRRGDFIMVTREGDPIFQVDRAIFSPVESWSCRVVATEAALHATGAPMKDFRAVWPWKNRGEG